MGDLFLVIQLISNSNSQVPDFGQLVVPELGESNDDVKRLFFLE